MKRREVAPPAPRPEVGDWLVWAAAAIAATYVAIHLYMLGDSLILWGGILEALVLGQ